MVYEFKVEPAHLDLAARDLWKLSEDNPQAVAYAKQWLTLDQSAGEILKPVFAGLQKAGERLQKNYETLGRVTDSSSTELTNSAAMYRSTDTQTAENLDRSYESPESVN